jgi:hypothetical protein
LKKIFLDISATNIDTLVPSLYQCVETRSMEVFLTVLHLRFNLLVISERFATMVAISRPSCEPLYAQTLPTVNRKIFFINILSLSHFAHQKEKCTLERCSSVILSSSTVAILTTGTNL